MSDHRASQVETNLHARISELERYISMLVGNLSMHLPNAAANLPKIVPRFGVAIAEDIGFSGDVIAAGRSTKFTLQYNVADEPTKLNMLNSLPETGGQYPGRFQGHMLTEYRPGSDGAPRYGTASELMEWIESQSCEEVISMTHIRVTDHAPIKVFRSKGDPHEYYVAVRLFFLRSNKGPWDPYLIFKTGDWRNRPTCVGSLRYYSYDGRWAVALEAHSNTEVYAAECRLLKAVGLSTDEDVPSIDVYNKWRQSVLEWFRTNLRSIEPSPICFVHEVSDGISCRIESRWRGGHQVEITQKRPEETFTVKLPPIELVEDSSDLATHKLLEVAHWRLWQRHIDIMDKLLGSLHETYGTEEQLQLDGKVNEAVVKAETGLSPLDALGELGQLSK